MKSCCDHLVVKASGGIFAALAEIKRMHGPAEAAEAADILICTAKHLRAEILGDREETEEG